MLCDKCKIKRYEKAYGKGVLDLNKEDQYKRIKEAIIEDFDVIKIEAGKKRLLRTFESFIDNYICKKPMMYPGESKFRDLIDDIEENLWEKRSV